MSKQVNAISAAKTRHTSELSTPPSAKLICTRLRRRNNKNSSRQHIRGALRSQASLCSKLFASPQSKGKKKSTRRHLAPRFVCLALVLALLQFLHTLLEQVTLQISCTQSLTALQLLSTLVINPKDMDPMQRLHNMALV